MLSLILAAAFLGLCLAAALKDVSTLTIPNWMNAAIAVLGLVALAAAGLGWQTAGWHFLAALAAFAVSVALYAFNMFGGGDAKMIPAVMLWLGPSAASPFLFGMAIAGGVLAVLLLPARLASPAGFATPTRFASLQRGAGVPYGVAIAAGVLYAAPHSALTAQVFGGF